MSVSQLLKLYKAFSEQILYLVYVGDCVVLVLLVYKKELWVKHCFRHIKLSLNKQLSGACSFEVLPKPDSQIQSIGRWDKNVANLDKVKPLANITVSQHDNATYIHCCEMFCCNIFWLNNVKGLIRRWIWNDWLAPCGVAA